MRTARTLHLIKGEWVCTYGPDDVPSRNAKGADEQRKLFFDPASWPAESKAADMTTSDGVVKRSYRHEAERQAQAIKEATQKAEDKKLLQKKLEADRVAKEAEASKARAKAEAEANARHIAEKEAYKAKLKADREAALAQKVPEKPKKVTQTTT